MDDLKTGLEIELVLPEGMTRLELLGRLSRVTGGVVERFDFPSKVPVPRGLAPAQTIALIEDIARHHQAELRGVAPDFAHFYLAHRAGRLRGGSLELQVVHDNTLAGGERVAELVTAPMMRPQLDRLAEVLDVVRAIDGVSTPDNAALHVHLDGAPFMSGRALTRLVARYLEREVELEAIARRPSGLRRAAPLPAPLISALREDLEWEAVRALLARHLPHRGFALNLYNLAHGSPEKLTVELKIAASTLEITRVREVREAFVSLGIEALDQRAS